MTKQIHLAAHFPGVNNTTVWSDPQAGSHIEFESFVHLAQTAERAKFDFFFLAEGLRLREQGGEIYDLDVVGRPDTFTVLAALAAVTEKLGLMRHDQLHVQRTLRGGPAVRLARPPVGRARRLERRDLVGRVHWRELPARWFSRPGRPVHPRGVVPAHGVEVVRHRGGPVRAHRRALRHQRHLRCSSLAAGPSGDPAGRRLRGRPRVRRCHRRRDLLAARHVRGGPEVLQRRERQAGQVRPHARPARGVARGHVHPRRHRRGRPGEGRGRAAAGRSAARPRSGSWSRCGTGT